MKKPVGISISVNGQDCAGIVGSGPVGRRKYSPETLEAIANVFLRAAAAIRAGEHGDIRGESDIASVGVEQRGGAFDDEEGLPVLATIRIARGTSHKSRSTKK